MEASCGGKLMENTGTVSIPVMFLCYCLYHYDYSRDAFKIRNK